MSKESQTEKLHRYQHLIEISRDLAATLSLEELLRRILGVAKELSDAEEASILLYDDHKKELYFHSATNLGIGNQLEGIAIPTESLAGWVAIHQKPVIVADVHKDKRWFGQVGDALNFSTRSLIAVPLLAKAKLIGVLEVLNKKKGLFNHKDQETLLVLGAQAAIAIENACLFQQSDLIAELVHELRTPLSSINTTAYLLLNSQLPPSRHTELLETIQRETLRLEEMTSAFLDLARLESGRMTFQMTLSPIKPILEECVEIFTPNAMENQITINSLIDNNLPEVYCDTAKIKQVFLNLLSNAVKYNQPHGSIEIEAGTQDHTIWVNIINTGEGISPDALAHLFEKFFRGKTTDQGISGTGLGLSICKHIIESHKGQISASSLAGGETTFRIQLPIRPV